MLHFLSTTILMAWLVTAPLFVRSASAEGADCTVPGPGFSFSVSSATGWTMDCHKTQDQANPAVGFSPVGEPPGTLAWTAVLYVTFCSRTQSSCRSAEKVMNNEAEFFRGKGVQVTKGTAVKTRDHRMATVIKIVEPSWYLAEAYVENHAGVVTISLTCRTPAAFDGSYSSFEKPVSSFGFVANTSGASLPRPPNNRMQATAGGLGDAGAGRRACARRA